MHYAGGLGWRFNDPGSGYDLGRRAIARALLDDWTTPLTRFTDWLLTRERERTGSSRVR